MLRDLNKISMNAESYYKLTYILTGIRKTWSQRRVSRRRDAGDGGQGVPVATSDSGSTGQQPSQENRALLRSSGRTASSQGKPVTISRFTYI